jgi:hypothetical protein
LWHLNVEKQEVGLYLLQQAKASKSTGAFTGYRKALYLSQVVPDYPSGNRFIIY